MHDRPPADERERLVAALSEAKLRLSDLTRNLDESLGFEDDDRASAELQAVREQVVELERRLAELDAKS